MAGADRNNSRSTLSKQERTPMLVFTFHLVLACSFQAAPEVLLERPLVTIVDKTGCAPNGDKREYYTLSPYWWPNPESPDGLPYVRRDGEVNPEANTDTYDRRHYFQMTDTIVSCAAAWQTRKDERFAECAARWARAWFVDEATSMRPGFRFGQSIPGKNEGSPEAIIRGMSLLDIHEALTSLPEAVWTEADRSAWLQWLNAYLDWLTTSEPGQRESRAFNNHGTWYDVQVATFAVATGREALAREVLAAVGEKRIRKQIKPDGRMTFELMRTKSWDYATMNLDAMTRMAELAQGLGIDVWGYETEQGASIEAAIDWLIPYANAPETWPAKQIVPFEPERLAPALRRYIAAHPDCAERYRETLEHLEHVKSGAKPMQGDD
ncbi:MAG: hypothetical protein GC168_01185 [Candidatus Hydrogenedens sp.]|nr:hypothetical protein [Candidatus Hydrogenedens sp.]